MNARTSARLLFITAVAATFTFTALADDPVTSALPATGGTWVAQGPGPITGGQVEGMTPSAVSGAVHAVVAHPTNANIVWIGAVNGGLWKTTNATNATPTWTPMTDSFGSLSTGALALDPTDGTFNTLVAGVGRYSSYGRAGGPLTGVMRTTNGGTNWTQLAATGVVGANISGIAARGATIVVSIDSANSFTCGNIGIYRSTNTGASFSLVSGGGSGLPNGRAFDLASDPTNNAVLYTAVRDAPGCSGGVNGVYKSTNTGQTWTKVSNAAMDAMMVESAIGNVRLAVGASGQVYAGIVNAEGEFSGLFRGTGGTSWTQLDTPSTNEGGSPIGIHPRKKPGGQGHTHFSIVADPTDANIVYVGGDRQPLTGDGDAGYPNSIGALNYTGRLFRVNAGAASGSQATPLTHCTTANASCNGSASTTLNSSPHADSRRMTFDAAGNLIEADDGGIYRRTNPRTTGDWTSMNGNLRLTEIHNIGYDRVSNMLVSGNQDTGSSEQRTAGALSWEQVNQGDGGDVAIDDSTSATQSTRYTSAQGLGGLYRRIVNASGVTTFSTFPALVGFEDAQFTTPLELNAITPSRVLIGGYYDLYESFDRCDTADALGFNFPATAMVYGGRSGGIDNPNLIWAITYAGAFFGPHVFVRTAGSGAPVATTATPGTTVLNDIAVNPNDWRNAFVVNSSGQVWSTTNTGAGWTNVTGNLASGTTDLRTIVYIPGLPDAIVVGGANGAFRMEVNNAGVWQQLGTGLSNALVWDLDYDALDDTLVAGTMGRGAWKLSPVHTGPVPSLSINDVSVTEGNSGTTNATFTVTLSAATGATAAVNYATAPNTATSTTTALPFTNNAPISIPSLGSGSPYPSTITVAGVSGTVNKVTVTLNDLSHTYASDIDLLLVGPGGESVVLMSDVGSSSTLSAHDLTFDDDAAASLPGHTFSSGTYKPTNLGAGDFFSSPAPAAPHGSALAAFIGTVPNGTWSLYIVDDVSSDSGTMAGGWTLHIGVPSGDFLATSGTLTFTPGTTTRTITVPVTGDTATESNETFFVNLSGASSATIADAQGIGTIADDDGGLTPPANVVATAATSTSVNITWTAAAGAASYRVYRSSNGVAFALVGSPAGAPFTDTTALANTAYLYKVRSFSGTESGDSNVDLATTVTFSAPVITADVTKIRAADYTELLTAVNAVRAITGLAAEAFSVPAPAVNVTLRAQHIIDLRMALDDARDAIAFPPLTYTDATLTPDVTKAKAVHIVELRNGVK